MRAFVCLGLLLAASAARRDLYDHRQPRQAVGDDHGERVSATTTRASGGPNGSTYTTTVTRSGGYQPMGSGGYNPMGH